MTGQCFRRRYNTRWITEAEIEMLAFVNREVSKGLRVTVQSVVEHFQRAPNGWYLAAIQCILAKLCARGKLEVRSDSNVLTDRALADAIRNTRQHANMVLEAQIEVPASKVRELKDFYRDFFDEPAPGGEVAALGKHLAGRFAELADELRRLTDRQAEFPFLAAVQESADEIRNLSKQKYGHYFDEVRDFGGRLLDQKDDVLDPIRQFMSGSMAEIYAEGRRLMGSATKTSAGRFPPVPSNTPHDKTTRSNTHTMETSQHNEFRQPARRPNAAAVNNLKRQVAATFPDGSPQHQITPKQPGLTPVG